MRENRLGFYSSLGFISSSQILLSAQPDRKFCCIVCLADGLWRSPPCLNFVFHFKLHLINILLPDFTFQKETDAMLVYNFKKSVKKTLPLLFSPKTSDSFIYCHKFQQHFWCKMTYISSQSFINHFLSSMLKQEHWFEIVNLIFNGF